MVDDSFDYFQSDTSQHTTHDNYIGIKYKFEAQRNLIFPYTVHYQKKMRIHIPCHTNCTITPRTNSLASWLTYLTISIKTTDSFAQLISKTDRQ